MTNKEKWDKILQILKRINKKWDKKYTTSLNRGRR